LVSRRNVGGEEAAVVCGGRLFHAGAAASGNARSPRVDRRVDGIRIVVLSTERRRRRWWWRITYCMPHTYMYNVSQKVAPPNQLFATFSLVVNLWKWKLSWL